MTIRTIGPGERYPMDLLLLADPEERAVQAYLSDSECYVLEHEGEIAGVCVLHKKDQAAAEVMNIAVQEELQRKGFGLKLLRHAVSRARELGCARISIATGNSSVGQLYLYQKAGFRIVGVEPDYFTGNYDNPIYENGLLCRDRILLSMELEEFPLKGNRGEAVPLPVSIETANHYIWGARCEGWPLVERQDLSVKQERMPAGTEEIRHYHKRARQFFYVLEGKLTITFENGSVTASKGQGIEVEPGVLHQARNESADNVSFLVVSSPTTRGDRHEASVSGNK